MPCVCFVFCVCVCVYLLCICFCIGCVEMLFALPGLFVTKISHSFPLRSTVLFVIAFALFASQFNRGVLGLCFHVRSRRLERNIGERSRWSNKLLHLRIVEVHLSLRKKCWRCRRWVCVCLRLLGLREAGKNKRRRVLTGHWPDL